MFYHFDWMELQVLGGYVVHDVKVVGLDGDVFEENLASYLLF